MKKKFSLLLACLLMFSFCLPSMVRAEKDVENTISLPAALIKGHTYDLQIADGKLNVNGESCESTFVAEGTQAVIAYTDAEGNAIASYTLPVIDSKDSADHCAYFYDPSGAVAKVENENDITLSFSKDCTVSFLSKLNPEDLAMYFAVVEEKGNFDEVRFTLTDAEDASRSLTFTVNMAAQTVYLGNDKAQLEDLYDVVQLRYKNASKRLMLGNDKTLFSCQKDDGNDDFTGFSAGVYLTVQVEGVKGASALRLTRLGNHPLGHKDSSSPDMTEPTLKFISPVPSTMYMNDVFEFPSYEVYDVYSPVVESSVTVEAPDGTVYTEAFTVSQYGKYKLTSTAKDGCGNQSKSVKMIFVNDDIAPEMTVSAMEKTSYKVGDKVKIPAYTVSDNLGAYNVDVILFLPNAEIRLLTHDATGEITYCLTDSALYNAGFIADNSSFKAEQTGKYTIRYVAYDDQYNRVVQELTFHVQ